MEKIYTAYRKEVNGEQFYFVKQFIAFPEIPGLEKIEEGYGMHSDFKKACLIAGIEDPRVQERLFEDVNPVAVEARVIPMNAPGRSVKFSN